MLLCGSMVIGELVKYRVTVLEAGDNRALGATKIAKERERERNVYHNYHRSRQGLSFLLFSHSIFTLPPPRYHNVQYPISPIPPYKSNTSLLHPSSLLSLLSCSFAALLNFLPSASASSLALLASFLTRVEADEARALPCWALWRRSARLELRMWAGGLPGKSCKE